MHKLYNMTECSGGYVYNITEFSGIYVAQHDGVLKCVRCTT